MDKSFNNWPNHAGFDTVHEERTPTQLIVKGHIPEYALGTLYRTGPQGHSLPTPSGKPFKINHWFDGFSQIHRFEIRNPTTVLYTSRYTCDGILASIQQTGKLPTAFSFAQRDPCESFFGKFQGVFRATAAGDKQKINRSGGDSGGDFQSIHNVGVTISTDFPGLPSTSKTGKGNIYTKTDANKLLGIDPETLEPVGTAKQTVLHPELSGQLSAAHARTDPKTGDVFNYNLTLNGGSGGVYKVFHVSASTGKTKVLATIKDAPAAYLHSFFLTERYVVLCVWGAEFSSGLKVLWSRNLLDALLPMDPKKPCKWYLIDRRGEEGVVGSYESTKPFFAFHSVNAWDEGDDVVCEVPVYDSLDILKKFYINHLKGNEPAAEEWAKKGPQSMLTRYRLQPGTAQVKVEWEVGHNWGMELPTLNPDFVMKPHRYTYALTNRQKSTMLDGIIKYDSETGEDRIWECHAHTPGEAVFVADPEGTKEDDGVLLSVVLDGKLEKSYLLVLDASTMTEVARAEMSIPVGFGFHGKHVGNTGGNLVEY